MLSSIRRTMRRWKSKKCLISSSWCNLWSKIDGRQFSRDSMAFSCIDSNLQASSNSHKTQNSEPMSWTIKNKVLEISHKFHSLGGMKKDEGVDAVQESAHFSARNFYPQIQFFFAKWFCIFGSQVNCKLSKDENRIFHLKNFWRIIVYEFWLSYRNMSHVWETRYVFATFFKLSHVPPDDFLWTSFPSSQRSTRKIALKYFEKNFSSNFTYSFFLISLLSRQINSVEL